MAVWSFESRQAGPRYLFLRPLCSQVEREQTWSQVNLGLNLGSFLTLDKSLNLSQLVFPPWKIMIWIPSVRIMSYACQFINIPISPNSVTFSPICFGRIMTLGGHLIPLMNGIIFCLLVNHAEFSFSFLNCFLIKKVLFCFHFLSFFYIVEFHFIHEIL